MQVGNGFVRSAKIEHHARNVLPHRKLEIIVFFQTVFAKGMQHPQVLALSVRKKHNKTHGSW